MSRKEARGVYRWKYIEYMDGKKLGFAKKLAECDWLHFFENS